MLFFFTNKVLNSLFQQIHVFQTLNESSRHSFFFCAIFENITCTPQSECFKIFSSSASQIRCTLKKKREREKERKFPQGIVLQEKILSRKVTYLKRGHLCKRNLSSGVEVCKFFGVSLSTETQHCPWKKEETNPTQ